MNFRYRIRTEYGSEVDSARDIIQATRKTVLAARRHPGLEMVCFREIPNVTDDEGPGLVQVYSHREGVPS